MKCLNGREKPRDMSCSRGFVQTASGLGRVAVWLSMRARARVALARQPSAAAVLLLLWLVGCRSLPATPAVTTVLVGIEAGVWSVATCRTTACSRECSTVSCSSAPMGAVRGRMTAVTDAVHKEHDAHRARDQENGANTHVCRLLSGCTFLLTSLSPVVVKTGCSGSVVSVKPCEARRRSAPKQPVKSSVPPTAPLEACPQGRHRCPGKRPARAERSRPRGSHTP
jgi:hypothetical protein